MSTDSLTSASALTGTEPWLALPPALAVPPGAGAICDADGPRKIGRGAAEGAFTTAPVMVAHASLTARRLGIAPPPRSSPADAVAATSRAARTSRRRGGEGLWRRAEASPRAYSMFPFRFTSRTAI